MADSRASTMVEAGGTDQQPKSSSRSPSVHRGEKSSDDTVDLELAISDVEDKDVKVPEESRDPNIVDWDGPDDPQNPLNWKIKKKVMIVSSIAIITFITPLGSSMFAPGVADVMREFQSHSPELASFVVSVYLLGYAFGPLILAPMSELYGRSPVYHVCNVFFVVFNVACAVANSLDSLIVFRFFAGVAGSAPLTIGAGSMADMIRQEKRGAAMAAWALGPLLGPVIGPIAGGYLTEAKGWRWTFWVLAIVSGAITINTFIFMRESYHPILLARKTKRLIKETGNQNLRSALDRGIEPKQLILQSIIRPTKMLFCSPIVFLLSLYVAVVYGYLYLLFTTISSVFHDQYNFSQGNVGLAFLGIGIGSVGGLGFISIVSDRLLKKLSAKSGEMKPEYRLPPLIPGGLFIPVGLFWYGWTAEYGVHYIVPIIGTFFVGVGMIVTMMATSTYLVDAYTIHAASAMAANTLLRSVIGAVLPLGGLRMYETLGLGWGNSLLAFIALALVPLPVIFFRYGERIRTSKRFQMTF
ncbi:multidrug resistance protein [Coccidioides immitis RS]|uniref:Multidrug resistance protein n=3 Tax=Coccidioides immitis TaxID=5501 RepID=J3K6R3_COCIM|nr:multidrug resistance protein [Coccidioides immitis RS]EAS30292.3 multidrug resistance protein [Coccidioides immitis RS]KMP02852.1 benomyl/methotrexate resistance protein [Coccidioides immitis RMSCC 2394]KMU91573.1 benomyl/methotrexate resistance protein [Coccidioides immitis H538.4]